MERYDTWAWTESFSSAPGWLMVLLGILLVVTLIMWIFLPFAIYGVKTILRQQNAHLAETQLLLKKVLDEMKPTDSIMLEKSTDSAADSLKDPTRSAS